MVYKDIGEEMLQHAFDGKCDVFSSSDKNIRNEFTLFLHIETYKRLKTCEELVWEGCR